MSAATDAEQRRQTWEAAKSPDYNVVNAPNYQSPSAPNVSNNAPAAPAALSPYVGSSVGTYHQTIPGGQSLGTMPTSTQSEVDAVHGVGNAPQAPSILAAQTDAAAQAAAAQAAQNRMADEQARQAKVTEALNQQKFDLEKAKADAVNAYNTSMLEFNNKQLAQNAFDATVLAAYRTRQNELLSEQQTQTAAYQTGQLANTAQANTSQVKQWGETNVLAGAAQAQTAAYQGQQIAVQQQSQLADLKKRRPFRSASIKMV